MSDDKKLWEEELDPVEDIVESNDSVDDIDELDELEEDNHEEADSVHSGEWVRGPGGRWMQA
jgi:hypothetical protein